MGNGRSQFGQARGLPQGLLSLCIACLIAGAICIRAETAHPAPAATVIEWGTFSPKSIQEILQESKQAPLANRMVSISRHFLGIPYQANTLIGGATVPEKLVLNLAGMDCFTFLDYVVALATASGIDSLPQHLCRIRYKSGIVAYTERNHFLTQWVENNSHLFGTQQRSGGIYRTKHLNQKSEESLWLEGLPVLAREINFVPRDSLGLEFYGTLQSGDILGFYTGLAGLDVTHVGLVVLEKGKPMLRHASSRRKKVVDEDLVSYLAENKKPDGIIVIRPR